MKNLKQRMAVSFTLVAILLATLITPLFAQVPVTHMRNIAIQVLSVTAGLTADDLTVSDDAVITDDFTVLDDSVLSGQLTLTGQTVITVTNNVTLSPTGAYQPIASAGAVGFSAITVGSAGRVLVLVNTVNQTITITDTGTLKLGGNAALGQYDSLTLISDGTNWIQLSKTDN